jgi:hypothetical protein
MDAAADLHFGDVGEEALDQIHPVRDVQLADPGNPTRQMTKGVTGFMRRILPFPRRALEVAALAAPMGARPSEPPAHAAQPQ